MRHRALYSAQQEKIAGGFMVFPQTVDNHAAAAKSCVSSE